MGEGQRDGNVFFLLKWSGGNAEVVERSGRGRRRDTSMGRSIAWAFIFFAATEWAFTSPAHRFSAQADAAAAWRARAGDTASGRLAAQVSSITNTSHMI